MSTNTAGTTLREVFFAFFYRPLALCVIPTVPYILAEAMVNHRKMVHPPSAG